MNNNMAFEALVNVWHRPGRGAVAAGIVQHGKILFRKEVGFANLEHAVPAHLETRFQIASLSKQFTAALALLLEDEGRFSLDDDVRDTSPLISHYEEPISLRRMLSHTSGLMDTFDVLTLCGAHIETPIPAEIIDTLYRKQRHLNFPTGTGFVYSNGGYEVAATILETLTGKSLKELLKEYVFDPIGMTNTVHVSRDNTVVSNEADGYLIEDGEAKRGRHGVPFNGGSGLLSTIDDMLVWEKFLLEGHRNLLSRLEMPARFENGVDSIYGLGTYVDDWNGVKISGHGGLLPGFKASVLRSSAHGTSVVVLSNSSDVDANELSRRLLELAVPGNIKAPASQRVSIKAGYYFEERKNEVFEVVHEEEGSFARFHGWRIPLLAAPSGDIVTFDDPLLHGKLLLGGKLGLSEWGEQWTLCHFESGANANKDLVRLTGRYRRDDIPTTLEIIEQDGGLRLEISGQFGSATYVLEQIDEDLFFSRSRAGNWIAFEMLIHFVEDVATSQLTLKITSDRTKAVSFRCKK